MLMHLYFYIFALKCEEHNVTKDEFSIIDKKIDKLFKAQADNEEQEDKFDDVGANEISADTDDENSSVNEKKPDDIDKINKNIKVPSYATAADNKQKIEDLTKKLNENLGLDDEITSLTDEKAWDKLYKHFEMNLGDYFIDGKFSIQLHIRYFMCCYIIIFIPGEFGFFYPALWPQLIPNIVLTNMLMKNMLDEARIFQKFVKEKSQKTLLISFFFGRQNSVLEDLKFLVQIPTLLFSDPLAIIRELLSFELRSEGYEEFKKNSENLVVKW